MDTARRSRKPSLRASIHVYVYSWRYNIARSWHDHLWKGDVATNEKRKQQRNINIIQRPTNVWKRTDMKHETRKRRLVNHTSNLSAILNQWPPEIHVDNIHGRWIRSCDLVIMSRNVPSLPSLPWDSPMPISEPTSHITHHTSLLNTIHVTHNTAPIAQHTTNIHAPHS